MLGRAAPAAIVLLIVASCGSAASPQGATVEPSPPSSSPMASPLNSVAPSPIATPSPSPVAIASPSPARTPRLDRVVKSFKLVSPGTGWVETDHGLRVTHNDGSSWVEASPNGDVGTLALDGIDGQTAFVATEKIDGSTATISIWHTTDGGQTWRPAKLASVPAPDTSAECGCEHLAVLIDAVDPLDVFADIVVFSGTDSESHDVFQSRDGGVTWAGLPIGIHANGSPGDLAIHFLTADTGSIVFDERTFTTRTGWGHWSEYPEQGSEPVPYPGFGGVTYLDDQHWIMGFPVAGAVLIAESTDAGRTWTTHTRPIPKPGNLSVSFVSAMIWIATIGTTSGSPDNKPGPAETWISRDAGNTWTFVGKLPTSDTWRSAFVDPSHAWVITSAGGLATTSNGGATWSTILGAPASGG